MQLGNSATKTETKISTPEAPGDGWDSVFQLAAELQTTFFQNFLRHGRGLVGFKSLV